MNVLGEPSAEWTSNAPLESERTSRAGSNIGYIALKAKETLILTGIIEFADATIFDNQISTTTAIFTAITIGYFIHRND